MNKTTLIARMRRKAPGLTTADASLAIDRVFNALQEVVDEGAYVRVPGFGTFRRRFRKARDVRNPRTGELSFQREHWVITFKQSKPKK